MASTLIPMIRVFLDASVLFAAAYSPTGAARELFNLAHQEKTVLVVSEFVLEEAERNLTDKAPDKLLAFKELLTTTETETTPDPTKEEVLAAVEHTPAKDAPVVAAAKAANVNFLATYDRKHLVDPPQVAEKSGLTIVTPDVVLMAIREQDSNDEE